MQDSLETVAIFKTWEVNFVFDRSNRKQTLQCEHHVSVRYFGITVNGPLTSGTADYFSLNP